MLCRVQLVDEYRLYEGLATAVFAWPGGWLDFHVVPSVAAPDTEGWSATQASLSAVFAVSKHVVEFMKTLADPC